MTEAAKKFWNMSIIEKHKLSPNELKKLWDDAFSDMTEEEFADFYEKWIMRQRDMLGLNDHPAEDEEEDDDSPSKEELAFGNDLPSMSLYRGDFAEYLVYDVPKDEHGWLRLKPETPPEIKEEYIKEMRYRDIMEELGFMVD